MECGDGSSFFNRVYLILIHKLLVILCSSSRFLLFMILISVVVHISISTFELI